MAAATATVLVPPTEITEATLPGFEEELMALVDAEGAGVVLDLAAVGFINSAGLGTLVKAGMRLDKRGRRLAFARAHGAAEHTIRLLGLDRKMPLFPTVEAACAHVESRSRP